MGGGNFLVGRKPLSRLAEFPFTRGRHVLEDRYVAPSGGARPFSLGEGGGLTSGKVKGARIRRKRGEEDCEVGRLVYL